MDGLYDTHVHIWSSDAARYPWQPILAQVQAPDYAFTAADLLSHMHGAGVTRAVLVQPSTYGWDHRYLVEALEAHPNSFRGVVLADPRDPDIVRQLTALASVNGVRGVRFHLLDAGQEEAFAAAVPSIASAARAGNLVVTVQAAPGRLGSVASMAPKYPELSIVVDHLGLIRWTPERSEGLREFLSLSAHRNVFTKLSGLEVLSKEKAPFATVWPFVRVTVEAFGADRVMWGSNAPHALSGGSYDELAGAPRECLGEFPASDVDLIMSGTAVRVWG